MYVIMNTLEKTTVFFTLIYFSPGLVRFRWKKPNQAKISLPRRYNHPYKPPNFPLESQTYLSFSRICF